MESFITRLVMFTYKVNRVNIEHGIFVYHTVTVKCTQINI